MINGKECVDSCKFVCNIIKTIGIETLTVDFLECDRSEEEFGALLILFNLQTESGQLRLIFNKNYYIEFYRRIFYLVVLSLQVFFYNFNETPHKLFDAQVLFEVNLR